METSGAIVVRIRVQGEARIRMTRALQLLLLATFCLLLIHTLIYFSFGIALIPFPFDYDQAEGLELNQAVLMADGGCPYCDNDLFPFFGSGYPPFFHLLMVPFVKVFGPQLWYGRLIIFGSTFITAGAISWAVRKESRQRLIALLAGMAFLSSNYVYHIGPLLRQHLLMVMLETVAVVIIASAYDGGRFNRRRLIVAIALLLCAGYTKQLAYATCIAVSVWLFLRNPRLAIRYCAGLLAAAGLVFALMMLATDSQWWVNIISANQNPYRWDQFLGLLVQFVRLHGWLLVLAAGIVLFELYCSRLSVYSIWFVAAFANTVAAGKWGAGDSYFTTALAAICILSGIALARSVNREWRCQGNTISRAPGPWQSDFLKQSAAWLAALLFLAYGLSVFKMPTSGPIFAPIAEALTIRPLPAWRYPLYDPAGWTVGYAVTGHLPSEEDLVQGWQIVDRIRETDGRVLSEDAAFYFLSGREAIGNAVHLRNLWENGLYDPTELVKMIESRDFEMIILRAALFPAPVLTAIDANYSIKEIISMNGFEYQLWYPQPGT